jgi:hypothetical protein
MSNLALHAARVITGDELILSGYVTINGPEVISVGTV